MNREVLINSLEEFMSETDARLAALEAAKPQAPAASCDEMLDTLLLSNADKSAAIANLTAELADLTRQRDNAWGAIDEYVEQRNALAAQVDDLRNINAGLRKDNERLAAEVERLAYDNANLKAGKSYWLNGSGTLLRRLNALEEQRNSLAAQVDDLRNVNAGLRKSNDTLRKDNDAHRTDYVNRESAIKNQRDVIAALRADNELLTDAATGLADDVIVLTEKTRLMKAALQMVEWVRDDFGEYSECPWCREDEDTNHNPSCPRQAALR